MIFGITRKMKISSGFGVGKAHIPGIWHPVAQWPSPPPLDHSVYQSTGYSGSTVRSARAQMPGTECKSWRTQELFELLEQFSIAGEVTVRVLPPHFLEHGTCTIESAGISFHLGR